MRHVVGIIVALVFNVATLNVTVHADESSIPSQPYPLQEPYTLEHTRAWHLAWGNNWPWLQQEHRVQLRDDGSEQVLLAVSGGARSNAYALFIQKDGAWHANDALIDLAHHPLHMLPAKQDGWHEFETYLPAWGSGGAEVWVFRYRWNGTAYEEAEMKEAKWCDITYFQQQDLCRSL